MIIWKPQIKQRKRQWRNLVSHRCIIFIYSWFTSQILPAGSPPLHNAGSNSRTLSISNPEAESIIMRLNDFFRLNEVAYWLNLDPQVVRRICNQSHGKPKASGKRKERDKHRIRLPQDVQQVQRLICSVWISANYAPSHHTVHPTPGWLSPLHLSPRHPKVCAAKIQSLCNSWRHQQPPGEPRLLIEFQVMMDLYVLFSVMKQFSSMHISLSSWRLLTGICSAWSNNVPYVHTQCTRDHTSDVT